MHFLFFEASFKNFGFFTKKNFFLGAVSYGAQEGIYSWVPTYFLAPKKELFLGAVSYGAQEKIHFGDISEDFERGL